ncbi:MAG: serine/threonine protein kinase [Planctomycetes bacterium]|nr:serine/threonine protein kinase [Planctomycetota bacterium]
MTKNQDKLSFGKLAVQLEFVTREQLAECTKIQRKIKELGVEPKKLGEVLLDKGYVTEKQVNHIFRVQGVKGGHTQITGYKVISRIGQGSMGYVYKALQISMDRIVAIKILSPKLGQNEKFVERFLREARSVARLNHPNIIQGIDVGESNGIYYFAMEYIDGPTIDKVIKKNGPLNEKKALKVMIQVARALEHAHKNNLVHRDIKPDNIMLTQTGMIKLCDLGLAKLVEPGNESKVEKRGAMGTPAYISPEQARGEKGVDIRSDIYSLGATFYFTVVGAVPFPSNSGTEAMAKHLTEPLTPPKQKNPRISEAVNHVIVSMMDKQKENRPQTPSALKKILEETLTGLGKADVITLEPEQLNENRPPHLPGRPRLRKPLPRTKLRRFRTLRALHRKGGRLKRR